nr:hypothetical protein [Microbacterium bovistercoris]
MTGIRRRVVFQAKCTDGSCELGGWSGPERDVKYMAAFDLARHNTDRHGGAERLGAEQ